MPDESFEQLQGIEVLVMNALRIAPHNTHQSLSEALEAVKRIGAKETWLIHMSHHIGLQAGCREATSSACAFCIRRA